MKCDEGIDGNNGRTDRILTIRRIKHPVRQYTHRVIREVAEEMLPVTIALAPTHTQRLAIQWMPTICDRGALQIMGIMLLVRPGSGKAG
jgi:hypothetical protein